MTNNIQMDVLTALRGYGRSGATVRTLSADTGYSASQVRSALARLYDKGHVFPFERGEMNQLEWEPVWDYDRGTWR